MRDRAWTCALLLAACSTTPSQRADAPADPAPPTDALPAEDAPPAAEPPADEQPSLEEAEAEVEADSEAQARDDATKRALAATIRDYLADLHACYQAQLGDDATLRGKMTYTITIEPAGEVSGVVIELDELDSEAMRACAVVEIESWMFEPQADAAPTEVSFSVNFTAS